MSIGHLSLVALDCRDPHGLADFYRRIVGGEIKHETASDEWVRLMTPVGSDLGFQRDEAYQPPDWPDGASQQAHLDFDVDDLDAGERQVVALGAVKADTQPAPQAWRVFFDPEGHPFCLVLA